jgi:hypothetical protein
MIDAPTGASGITGWAITNALIEGYPDESTFSKVTALTNRPLIAEAAQWLPSEKLQVVSGLDLLTEKGQEGLEAEMKQKVKGIENVTHVYFFGKQCVKIGVSGEIAETKQHILWISIRTRRLPSMSNCWTERFKPLKISPEISNSLSYLLEQR